MIETVRAAKHQALSPIAAEQLVSEYGSPLYVYDADVLRSDIERITSSITYPGVRFCFASVTNGNISLLRIFHESGWGLHANTPGDVYLGLQAGFAPGQIIYSGSNLSPDEMNDLLGHGVKTFNLDSISQLELFCQVHAASGLAAPRVGLRINLPGLTGETRIGVRQDELAEAVGIAAGAGLKINGLHFYRGTGTNSTSAFIESIDPVLATGRSLPDWEYLDFGGGFGYRYRDDSPEFDWNTFGRELDQRIRQFERQLALIIEPGRAAIAGCGILLARIVSTKWQGEKQIVGVDTSVANISVLSVHGGYRKVCALSNSNDSLHPTDVCGNTTFSRDYLGRRCPLPALSRGDLLAILDSGAYGYAMSSHFLHRPRPAEVLVENGEYRLIRRRETYDVLTGHQH